MRIAILSCLDFQVPGGAERFFIDLAMALDATIVCLSVHENLFSLYPDAKKVHFSPLNIHLPREPLRQISGMNIFKRLRLDYDFYIATDDMALRFLKKNRPHLYYMLTPRRALYDMAYPTLEPMPVGKKQVYALLLWLFRSLDRRYVKRHVREIACISHTVRTRIWKAYQRPAKVIYPPIHVEKYKNQGSGDFWLSVSRIDKWKRIDLQVDAFRTLPDKSLLIAGRVYPEYESLVSAAPQNVRFLGPVSDEELIALYEKCRGFITTAIDEDYGLTPLEAMACGKPVIGVCEGGYQETILQGSTGLLVEPEVEELAKAVCTIDENPDIFAQEARRRAEQFDYKIFKEQIVTYVHACNKKFQIHG